MAAPIATNSTTKRSATEILTAFIKNESYTQIRMESRRFRQPIFQEGVSASLVNEASCDPFLED